MLGCFEEDILLLGETIVELSVPRQWQHTSWNLHCVCVFNNVQLAIAIPVMWSSIHALLGFIHWNYLPVHLTVILHSMVVSLSDYQTLQQTRSRGS